VSRFSKALALALAVHGLLFFVRTRHAAGRAGIPTRAPEELVEIDDSVVEAAPRDAFAAIARLQPTSRVASALPVAGARANGAPESTALASADAEPGGDAPANDGASATASAGSAQATANQPERKIDFGIDDGFFMRPANEVLPRVPKSELQHQLEAALSADDVKRGLARGNALLGALGAAVRDVGPVRGEAILSVTVDANGSVMNVEFLRGSAADWSSALDSFRALAAHQRLRVPSGARGLRVTFSVKAKVQRPSGKDVGGSGDDDASGTPSLALRGTYDVADLSGASQRLVYAHVLSEEIL
jgi:hypothetical protein